MKELSEEERQQFQLGVRQYRAVMDFTTAIEDEMRRSEIKPSALADKINKTRQWVFKVLRKKPNLTFFTAVELADALGMEIRIGVAKKGTPLMSPAIAVETLPEAPDFKFAESPAGAVGNEKRQKASSRR